MPVQQQHNHYGDYANVAALPDDTAEPNLKAGDLAYATAEARTYTCTDPTTPTWVECGPSTVGVILSIETGRQDYTLSGSPPGPEEVVGQFMFDASKIPEGGSVKMRCMMDPTFSGAGGANIHIDDLGAPGALSAPVRVTGSGASAYKLESSASGLDYFETAAYSTHPTTPAEGQIVDGPRMYEVVVTMPGGTSGDTIDVGFAGLYVEL